MSSPVSEAMLDEIDTAWIPVVSATDAGDWAAFRRAARRLADVLSPAIAPIQHELRTTLMHLTTEEQESPACKLRYERLLHALFPRTRRILTVSSPRQGVLL